MVEKVMYMDRKTRIMEIISSSDKPVSASKIAKELGVSRHGTLTVAEPLILKNVDYNVIFLSNFLF